MVVKFVVSWGSSVPKTLLPHARDDLQHEVISALKHDQRRKTISQSPKTLNNNTIPTAIKNASGTNVIVILNHHSKSFMRKWFCSWVFIVWPTAFNFE